MVMVMLQDVLAAFLQWQTKIDYLFDKAKDVVPVPQRITTLQGERPVIALTDFSSKQVTPSLHLLQSHGSTSCLIVGIFWHIYDWHCGAGVSNEAGRG